MIRMSDAYAILWASQYVSPSDIWGSHHRLALLTHPDKVPLFRNSCRPRNFRISFKLMANACEVLIDSKKRANNGDGGKKKGSP
jgi:DnaJ-class molecular chaperone